jgi:hypothetical protein
MSKSGGGRERRPEGVLWLHVPYFQYDGLGGVKWTALETKYFLGEERVRKKTGGVGGLTESVTKELKLGAVARTLGKIAKVGRSAVGRARLEPCRSRPGS